MSRDPAGCSVDPNTCAKDGGVVIIDNEQGISGISRSKGQF